MPQKTSGGGLVRTIRANQKQLTALLDRMDEPDETRFASFRRSPRFDYRVNACVVHIQQPGDADPVPFVVTTRNISARGMAFIHGGYVHKDTQCVVQLAKTNGTWHAIVAKTVRCRYIEGNLHEVAVVFETPIEPGDFCASALVRRVLLADDDERSARVSLYHLKKLNCEVDPVRSGREAVERARKTDYDVILLDLDTPELGGFEAVQRLRADGFTGAIVGSSATSGSAERQRALQAGFDLLLEKPLSPKALRSALDLAAQEPLLSSFRDDPDMAELIDEFVAELAPKRRALTQAFESEDARGLEAEARSLKANAGAFGFAPISEAAGMLEQALRDGAPRASIGTLLSELSKRCRLARAPKSPVT